MLKKSCVYFFLVFCHILFFIRCADNIKFPTINNNSTENTDYTLLEVLKKVKIDVLPLGKLKIGDKVEISIGLKDSLSFDSIALAINNIKSVTVTSVPLLFKWNTSTSKVGRQKVDAIVYKNKKSYISSSNTTLLSDIKAYNFGYKIINTFPHDKTAYTQGLFIYKGIIYESTGLKGESSLRKVKFETGEILQSFSIPTDIFGEGITLYDNKIIQLTYQDHEGFVYELDNFKLIQKFNYPTEGWGIATVDNKLVMSDGSFILYYLDPQSFAETDRLEIYDDTGPVYSLNELEYIEGELFANIYQTDKIARIDLKTGKVSSYINIKGILSEDEKEPGTDVLNGIAYDKDKKRLFITGKRWPKLFEIKPI